MTIRSVLNAWITDLNCSIKWPGNVTCRHALFSQLYSVSIPGNFRQSLIRSFSHSCPSLTRLVPKGLASWGILSQFSTVWQFSHPDILVWCVCSKSFCIFVFDEQLNCLLKYVVISFALLSSVYRKSCSVWLSVYFVHLRAALVGVSSSP